MNVSFDAVKCDIFVPSHFTASEDPFTS